MKQLGDILLEGGFVTQDQLTEAFDEHQRLGRSLGRVLVDRGILSESQLVAALAQQIGLRFVDLTEFPVDGSAVARVPEPVCRRHTALPIAYEDGRLLVAMADPANVFAIDDIRSLTGLEVKPLVATRADVIQAIARSTGRTPSWTTSAPTSTASTTTTTCPTSRRWSRTRRSSSSSTC